MSTFTVNRKLLNPKFEGYKFDFVDQDQVVSRYPLQHPVTQATTSTQTWLSLHEVQSRITHNHLTLSSERTSAVYVDEEYNVVLIDVTPETLFPSFRIVFELPKPISSSFAHSEYPSASYISSELLLVSDGHGFMYLLRTNSSGPFQLAGIYQLVVDGSVTPFLIDSAGQVTSDYGIALLSSSHRGPKPDTPTKKSTPVDFDVWAAKVTFTLTEPSEVPQTIHILWNRRGEQVPILSQYDSSQKAFMLIGGSPYRDVKDVVSPPYEPSPDEIAPVPRVGENLDAMQVDPAKPPPYSWTQTSDSVTVAFPLPSTTLKSAINVKFTVTSLTLSISDSVSTTVVPLPTYHSKMFWDGISPSSSYWTWDKEAEHSFGILSLHLDKQHEGTKWMQVFASAGKSMAAELSPEDVEVPETLDPSELWLIRESLEKYTAALLTGEDASGLGLGRGVPSLGEGEMDEEVDSTVGRTTVITWVYLDGSSPSWSNPGREYPYTLLSTPLPGHRRHDLFSLVLKEGLDGPAYDLQPASNEPDLDIAAKWIHTSTFPALGFVLASKQDVRFTHHNENFVFALESGLRNRGGNMYVYRRAKPSAAWAKQSILKIGDGAGGALLGVGAFCVEGHDVILALTEKQLVIVRTW
ncbi:hypothetical protein J3R30DRAFT_3286626 [Lentinula aciculospora]|uniref:NudC domain-containing protein 1 n=1 Tax=Lentinula aciculospora TaxID=153920 RepID=A0A9W9DRR0_9AGAR|nr:hypothetical protein J3R30DRAFT_3286626 [Lentinula aciculospora]